MTYRCENCGHFTSPTAGTILHKTRTSLLVWFWTIFLVAFDKRGHSALQLESDLGVSYFIAWSMIQRIRRAMGERDAMYKLQDIVELDETYYGSAVGGDRRGRGTSKMKVIVALSLSGKFMGFVKMKIVDRIDSDTVKEFIQNGIEKGSKIITDGLSVYLDLNSIGYIHERRIVGDQKAHEVLPSIHTVVSNAKSFITGTYHGLDKKHFQYYLDEFCYRFNRRMMHDELFSRLLLACLRKKEIFYRALIQ
jgi:transposase-like protein